MKKPLIELTESGSGNTIYIAPDCIISIEPVSGHPNTQIYLLSGLTRYVDEPPAKVRQLAEPPKMLGT